MARRDPTALVCCRVAFLMTFKNVSTTTAATDRQPADVVASGAPRRPILHLRSGRAGQRQAPVSTDFLP
jgi:hypothetical protein